MKIKIISDLHIDHNRAFKLNTKFDDAFTIIAGDISQVEGGKENLLANVKNGI
jgi:predicted phosphodiesterase